MSVISDSLILFGCFLLGFYAMVRYVLPWNPYLFLPLIVVYLLLMLALALHANAAFKARRREAEAKARERDGTSGPADGHI